MEWYAAGPKYDRRAPASAGEEADEEAPKEGKGEGGWRNEWPRCLIWISKPLLPDFEA